MSYFTVLTKLIPQNTSRGHFLKKKNRIFLWFTRFAFRECEPFHGRFWMLASGHDKPKYLRLSGL